MSDTSGHTSQMPFAFYDPDMSCLRTCAATLLWDSTEFSVTLPVSGSMRSGQLFQQPRLVPATDGSDYSSLLPTPTRRDHKGRNQRNDDTCLPGALLPTPVADNSRGLPSPTTDYQSLANSCQPQHRSPTRTRSNPKNGSNDEPTLFSEPEPTTDSR